MGTEHLSQNSTETDMGPKLRFWLMIALFAQLKPSEIGSKLTPSRGQETCPVTATQVQILTGKEFVSPFVIL